MSFILDALKKSESDRQRQSGPALYEVKVAPPRGALPPWAVAVVILLAINLMIGLWMLLRHPFARPATESAAAPAPVGAPLPAPPATSALTAPAGAPAA